MVGVTGFEPAAPCSQSTCATELRYTPLGHSAYLSATAVLQATFVIIANTDRFVNPFFLKKQTFFLVISWDGDCRRPRRENHIPNMNCIIISSLPG